MTPFGHSFPEATRWPQRGWPIVERSSDAASFCGAACSSGAFVRESPHRRVLRFAWSLVRSGLSSTGEGRTEPQRGAEKRARLLLSFAVSASSAVEQRVRPRQQNPASRRPAASPMASSVLPISRLVRVMAACDCRPDRTFRCDITAQVERGSTLSADGLCRLGRRRRGEFVPVMCTGCAVPIW